MLSLSVGFQATCKYPGFIHQTKIVLHEPVLVALFVYNLVWQFFRPFICLQLVTLPCLSHTF